jgi:hypothetical protein
MSLPDGDIHTQLLEEAETMNHEWGVSPKEAGNVNSNQDKPPQLVRTSEMIGNTLQAIREGNHQQGQYPAVERAIQKHPRRHIRSARGTRAGPPTPSPAYSPQANLISDVNPTIRERLAVVEHVAGDLREKFEDHRHESIRAAERVEQTFAPKSQLQGLESRVDALERKSLWKVISVAIATSATVIAIVWYAVQLGSKLAQAL